MPICYHFEFILHLFNILSVFWLTMLDSETKIIYNDSVMYLASRDNNTVGLLKI